MPTFEYTYAVTLITEAETEEEAFNTCEDLLESISFDWHLLQ